MSAIDFRFALLGCALGVALASAGAWAQPYCAANPDSFSCIVKCGGTMLGTGCEMCPMGKTIMGIRPNNGEDELCVMSRWTTAPDLAQDDLPVRQGSVVTLAPGINLSSTIAGTVELSPDQKLARAYALCHLYSDFVSTPDCDHIARRWLASPSIKALDDQQATDRAFIEEVARGLK